MKWNMNLFHSELHSHKEEIRTFSTNSSPLILSFLVSLLSFLTSVEWLRSEPISETTSTFALNLPNLSRAAFAPSHLSVSLSFQSSLRTAPLGVMKFHINLEKGGMRGEGRMERGVGKVRKALKGHFSPPPGSGSGKGQHKDLTSKQSLEFSLIRTGLARK